MRLMEDHGKSVGFHLEFLGHLDTIGGKREIIYELKIERNLFCICTARVPKTGRETPN